MGSNNENQSYADKCFVIEGESEHQRKIYSTQVGLFGDSIKAVEVKNIRHIDDNHWFVQLLDKHTSNLEKLCFKTCSFKNVDDFLSRHTNITHLAFRSGSCEEKYRIQLPEYRNLKSLQIFKFSHISKPSLEKVLMNNSQMERLTLSFCDHYFTLQNIMELVCTHLNHLKELNILDCYSFGMDFSPVSLRDQFVSVLKSLESFGMTSFNECSKDLLQQVSSSCTDIKSLELYNFRGHFNKELIEAVCSFDQIETLSLLYCSYQDQLESIIENLPNLRCLYLQILTHRTNTQILSILRKCKHLEKLVIDSERSSETRDEDESVYNKNVHFHGEFIEAIPNSDFRLEFKEYGEVIGVITKEEIIWRNKLLHWVGYDPIHSRSNLRLLDLITIPEGSTGKHKQPLNLIFNYLDLDSLYSFSMASKECKQLVHGYIYQRCKQSSKKRPNQRSIERQKFVLTDEYGINYKGLRMFGKNIRFLEVNLLDYRVKDLLKEIEKHCKHLTTLCFRTHRHIDPYRFILPQIRHFVFYDHSYSLNGIFECDLSKLSQQCPNLEIFEMKTVAKLYTGNWKKPLSFENLQKIKFKPVDDSQVKYAKELFKNSSTKVIVDC
ncbi:uncharacterized protein LOC129574871 [Sitodiplosis mosellana]|uniref:uncharacterized protein LOC129574871 n=1 Tax=Sitodiplosis mosellana TaxID=263140 RepID=UPI002444DEF7|nr:uncharacterized protein LOC129574871 [Sitodiplosis mosellana]XP_055313383.1 uncharacterized protein LOC129574871 [Sitodiplosis mosellana]XP_055313384.1 uncharacterized protein LOC129574871 [Sitodiplosis mosellana]